MKIMPVSSAFLLFIFLITFLKPCKGQSGIADTAIIATVENEPVVAGELKLIAQQYRANTISRFLSLCSCSYSSGFWITPVNGVTPAAYLKKMAFDTLVRTKVQQLLARQYNALSDISYSGFLRQLEKENQRRKDAVRDHQAIYGPVKYSETVYYNYLYHEMTLKLKKALDQAIFQIDQDTVERAYQLMKTDLCCKGYLSEVAFQRTNDGEAVADSIDSPGESKITVNDTVPLAEDDPSPVPLIRFELRGLREGDISRTFGYQGLKYRFLVLRKEPLGFRSLQECGSLVHKVLLDRHYDTLINDKVKTARIIIRSAAWDAVSF